MMRQLRFLTWTLSPKMRAQAVTWRKAGRLRAVSLQVTRSQPLQTQQTRRAKLPLQPQQARAPLAVTQQGSRSQQGPPVQLHQAKAGSLVLGVCRLQLLPLI